MFNNKFNLSGFNQSKEIEKTDKSKNRFNFMKFGIKQQDEDIIKDSFCASSNSRVCFPDQLTLLVNDIVNFNTSVNFTSNLILAEYENTILNSVVNSSTFVGTNIYQNYNFNSLIEFKPQLILKYSLGELYLNTKINNYIVDDNRYKFNFMNFGVNKKVGCKITSFVSDKVIFAFKVSNSSILTIYIYQNSIFNLLILGDLFLSLDIYLKTPFNDAIKGALFIGLDIYQQIIYLSKALHDLSLGLDIYQRFEPEYSIIYTSLKIVVLIAEIVHLDITLNKGDTLTLDSENYNFLVNNQNFIHKHHGDWITLDRNLHNLKIVNSSGQITGKILYNERFF